MQSCTTYTARATAVRDALQLYRQPSIVRELLDGRWGMHSTLDDAKRTGEPFADVLLPPVEQDCPGRTHPQRVAHR